MKRKIFVVALIALFVLSGCSYLNKYGPYKVAIKIVTKAFDVADSQLKKAENAGDVARTLKVLASALKTAGPKMKKITDEYPELKKPNPPEEVADDIKEWKKVSASFKSTLQTKLQEYGNDKAVQEAKRKFTQAVAVVNEAK